MYYYVNQRNYTHISYPTLTDLPDWYRADTTVSSSGCGLCAAAMVITNMTGKEFSLADSLELSLRVNANHSPGTDMDRFAPYIAERFDLNLVMTEDPELVRQHLIDGYMAIATATGDRPEDGHIGVFSHGGHYVAVVGIDDDHEHITVLDPSLVPGKYEEEGREQVIVNDFVLHTTMAVLAEDCKFREPADYPDGEFKAWMEFDQDKSRNRYYLFSPKAPAADKADK